MAEGLIIWGSSGHALVVADVVRVRGGYEIVGFLDDDAARHGAAFGGARVLGGAEALDDLKGRGVGHALVAVGANGARLRLTEMLAKDGWEFPAAVHVGAVIAGGVTLGPGTVVMAGAVINPGARIGRAAVVNTAASVDHECVIGDGASICPGVRLGGKVEVGRAAWVGIGSVVREGVRIGEEAVIGAGSVVLGDVPARVVAYGCPARVIRSVAEG